jgi:hypothetical protein
MQTVSLHPTHTLTRRPHRLCLLCFWTVKASVSLCSYVVNDKPAYNPEDSAVDVRPPRSLQDV